jgi:hypothetical protein
VKLTDISAVPRAIDPRHPTNVAIFLLALVVGAGGTLAHYLAGSSWLESLLWGAGAGVAVVIAWALGRELDPDHDLSAFVAAGLALLGLFFFDLPGFLGLVWTVVLLRVVNRTPGLPARLIDSLGLLGLGSWMAWQGSWALGIFTALGFALDARLPSPQKRQLRFAGLALLAAFVSLGLGSGLPAEEPGPWPLWAAALGTSALFVLVVVRSRRVHSLGDATGEPLHPRRVQAAQSLGLLVGLQAVWWGGVEGLAAWHPLWAALLGVALYAWACLIARMPGIRTR